MHDYPATGFQYLLGDRLKKVPAMFRHSTLAAVAAMLSFVPVTPASAQLMIAPTRVVLTPSQRSMELVLVNKGEGTAAFRIAIENRRMAQDGSMEDAPDTRDGELFAADKIRATPRQLMIEPGGRQTLRVSASDIGGLAPGEYRAHLRVMSAPVAEATTATPTESNDNSLSIQLIAVRSVTIPVLLRVGELGATATIERASYREQDKSILAVRLARSGTRSTYGDLVFTEEGAAEPAYRVRGIAVYVPNAERDVLIPLPDDVRKRLAGRRVRIDYVSSEGDAPGRIASQTVEL